MWQEHSELNWCPECWFSAKIESKEIPVGRMYLCRNCGIRITCLTGSYVGSLGEMLPQYFTDDEWQEYWSKNIQNEKT